MDDLTSQLTAQPKDFAQDTEDYANWLNSKFPHVASKPLAERHHRLWRWFDALKVGQKPRPRVEPWPRGGAKSSTGELGVCYIGCKQSRKFVLYVSETQDQADRHVQSVGTLFEKIGIGRSLNKYGNSKGWRRNQLRTENGFNVEALGLDTASRGIKLDEFRPDLIVFDDIDNQHDTPKITAKKAATIKSSIIPAGSSDCAILFLQNLIIAEGIVSSLVNGTADFLHNREVATVEPAIRGLETAREEQPDGTMLYRIVSGEPTWEGQDLEVCEGQINEWGLPTFLRESQHEVEGVAGLFFDVSAIRFCDPEDIPADLILVRGWDLGATQGGGDPTVGALMGRVKGSKLKYVIDVKRQFYATNDVKDLEKRMAEADNALTVYDDDETTQGGKYLRPGERRFTIPRPHGSVKQRYPQDPGQAGKAQAFDIKEGLADHLVETKQPRRKKSKRHQRFQAELNKGNVIFVRGPWNKYVLHELKVYREDEQHEYDDVADALADADDTLDPPTAVVKEDAYEPPKEIDTYDPFLL